MSPQPTAYAPGARVLVRDEEWIVRGSKATADGQALQVLGVSELVRDQEAIFLTELDEVTELRPEDTQLVEDRSPGYRRSRLYLDTLLRRSPATGDGIYVGHRGAMDSARYQLVPAQKALERPRPRILIADAVGLGKTVEAGVLLSELIRRGRGDRILVVALKSMLSQIQEELWGRFTIPLVRLDSAGIQRVRSKIPSHKNPFHYYDRVIVSIDTLKKNQKYQHFLDECRWDAIVIDECQHVAERGSGAPSQRAQLAQQLAPTTDSLIMTSATPHDGRPESFASLMNLLDPTAIADPQDYTQEEIGGLYVRRFKKDIETEVGESFRDRELSLERVETNDEEDRVFDLLADAEFRTVGGSGDGTLFRTLLLKAFLSSPQACASTVRKRLDHPDVAEPSTEAAEHDRRVLEELLEAVEAITPDCNTKLRRLVELLEQWDWSGNRYGDRVVVFAERLDTLEMLREYLVDRFNMADDRIAIFDGNLDDQRQQELVGDFGTKEGKVQILLGSDAAAEGINLHYFCHRLVHFDVPWSLITLEQRNGRIDRFGQTETPDIRYLLSVPDSDQVQGDLRVVERLIEKERAAHENLGDAASLMEKYDADEEEEHVAEGIARGDAPEEIVPDEPQGTLLDMLFGEDEESTDPPEIRDEFRVFDSDLDYARQAFEELVEAYPDQFDRPEWHPRADGFTLQPPDDLEERYEYLPDELTRGRDEFKLSADREIVQRAFEESREQRGSWPEWELFWDLHPVAEWLQDRVLGLFHRNEATVVQVDRGLGDDEAAYVFQGVVSNRRSQPVIVDWFGVVFGGDDSTRVVALDELAEATGLEAELPTPDAGAALDYLSSNVPDAVEVARDRMLRLRDERKERLQEDVKEQFRRVEDWYNERKRVLEERLESYDGANGFRARKEKEIERELAGMKRLMQRRQEWFMQGLNTVPDPYLRLALVIAG